MLQLGPVATADADARPVAHNDDAVAGHPRLQLDHPVQIDEGRAMHTTELRRVERLLERFQRRAQETRLAVDVQQGVVAEGVDPVDLADFRRPGATLIPHEQTRGLPPVRHLGDDLPQQRIFMGCRSMTLMTTMPDSILARS